MSGNFEFNEDDQSPRSSKGKNPPTGRPLLQYRDTPPDPQKSLLGLRFLCAEGAALRIGPSGTGKSSASIQMGILWSIGKPAFNLAPSRPLKIAIIQAEDDPGDIHEMVAGACSRFGLTPDQITLCEQNCTVYHHKALTADRFLNEVVEPVLDKDRPDIVIINPLQAFLGADVKDTEKASRFLRNGINPLLEKYQCACVMVHHTPKTNFRDTGNWRASDWMYAGAGAADITNWARAVIIIEPSNADRVYKFIAAKRGNRSGWAKRDKTHCEFFAWATDHTIFWRDATSDEIKKAESKKWAAGTDEVLAIVPMTGRIEKIVLQQRANLEIPMGEKRVDTCIATLIRESLLFYEEESRPGIRPKIWVSRFAPVSPNGGEAAL